MKKKMVVLLSFTLVVAAAIGTYFVISSNKNKTVNAEVTMALTPQIINRLQSYPYYENKPMLGFDRITKEKPELAKWIVNTLSKVVTFDANEKFFTNEKLTYLSWDNHFVVRGVYQVKAKDGTITEQDVEFEYKYGDTTEDNTKIHLNFVGERKLDKEKIIKG